MDNDAKETDLIATVFGVGGLLESKLQGYEARVGQVELAYAVLDGMVQGGVTVAEAPTGTGKSVGYGVPATIRATANENTVIVTANIALQEQLVGKDLPFLKSVLPWEFKYALAKGVGNYLCERQFADTMNETVLNGFQGSSSEKWQWSQIVRWKGSTKTGDVSELSFEPAYSIRNRFTVQGEDCTGRKCKFYEQCLAMKAKAEVAEADIIVTNYALYFIDLLIKRNGGNGVFPDYSHVVFDEGHKAADYARGFLSTRMSRGAVEYAIRSLDSKQSAKSAKGPLGVIDVELRAKATVVTDKLFALLTSHYHSEDYNVRFVGPWKGRGVGAAVDFINVMSEVAKAYVRATNEQVLTDERKQELSLLAAKCEQYSELVRNASKYQDADQWIYHLQEGGERISLGRMPISVADRLSEWVFESGDIKSVVVTSATLATRVDDYDYVCSELGIAKDNAELLTVESPFDLGKSMIVVCPPMPLPSSDRFVGEVARRVLQVIESIGGRTLCLFTSYRNMNAVYELVDRETELPLLKQGDAPRMQLIERFKLQKSTVLFGTESFWAGVDVPGEALSCVIIDKLPFPNLGDPLHDVLKEKYSKAYFFKYSIPAAVIAFRQGVGRLIRTTKDRGAIVVLDSRMVDKPYGSTFRRSFPALVKMVRDIGAVQKFLELD